MTATLTPTPTATPLAWALAFLEDEVAAVARAVAAVRPVSVASVVAAGASVAITPKVGVGVYWVYQRRFG